MAAGKTIALSALNWLKHASQGLPGGRRTPPARLVIAALLCGALWSLATGVAAPLPTEYQIKSAFLYNFAKYVQWPAGSPKDSFDVCVLGKDPFGAYLDTILEDKTINGAKMGARRISQVSQAADCQILFISSSEESRLVPDLDVLAGKSVLTVGETAHFAERGGMIQFVVEESRVRFQINVNAADRAGLTISSQLLKLAMIVTDRKAGGD